ncbi:hypothetical protein QTP88_025670 [Uroleucon formosanum]
MSVNFSDQNLLKISNIERLFRKHYDAQVANGNQRIMNNNHERLETAQEQISYNFLINYHNIIIVKNFQIAKQCAHCNREFSKKCNLITHIKLHMEGRTIKSLKPLIDAVIKLDIINMNFVSFQGHNKEVKYLPIPKKVQESIADKVKSGVPPNVIIDQLRDDFDYNVEKKNIITLKDVYNISSKCGLLHKYKLHDVDALSVDLQVKKFQENPSNPIIMYKTQGTEYFPLDINDFMLIILTETQRKVIKKFGSRKLCIDSTHGTNQYNFNLTTIVVIDEFGGGYPADFCINENFKILVKLCNSGKDTHYVNVINNRHRSVAQIHGSNINETSTITWTVKLESLEEEYLVKKCEPCASKAVRIFFMGIVLICSFHNANFFEAEYSSLINFNIDYVVFKSALKHSSPFFLSFINQSVFNWTLAPRFLFLFFVLISPFAGRPDGKRLLPFVTPGNFLAIDVSWTLIFAPGLFAKPQLNLQQYVKMILPLFFRCYFLQTRL